MDIIVVILMMCGRPDTVILKLPDRPPVATEATEEILDAIDKKFTKDSTLIIYEDNRIKCI